MGGVQKNLKETKGGARPEKGESDLFETRIFTKAKAVCLCCPVFVVHAMLPASSLSVCLSSCPAVQNHQPSQRSSPRPVSHDPCPRLDHTKADSVPSACVRVSPTHVNLFIRQNVCELCVFVCVSMTQRDSGAKKLLKRPQLYFHCSGLVEGLESRVMTTLAVGMP